MSLSPSRANAWLLPLTGASILALSTALHAQSAPKTDGEFLGVIHLVSNGKDNVEATGGTEIDAEDLARLQPADISDLFSRASTVAVSGGGGAAKKVTVLGVEQSLLATTVDGVPQGATAWHHTGSSVIDPTFLKAVKVEAGAAAADSGFGAAAGSLRYETLGANDLLAEGQNLGGRLGLSYGSNGRGGALNLAGYGRYKSFDWFLMTNATDGKDYKDGNGDVSLGTAPSSRNVLAKLGFEAEGHRFEIGLESSLDDGDRLIKANLSEANKDLHPLKVSRDTVKLSYTSTAPTEVWDPTVELYLSKYEYWRPNYATGTRGNNGDAIFNEEQFGGKAQNVFDLGFGKITAGVDFNQHDYAVDSYGDGNSTGRRYRNFSTQQVGLFAQGRFEFESGIKLSTGARLDQHRFDTWDGERFSDTGTSVNATLSYSLNDNIEVFAGASDTWLGYVIGDYGYIHARAPAFGVDPDLQAGKAKNYKLGANFGGDAWQASLTLFDTKISNLFDYVGTDLHNNTSEFRSKGFTLGGNYDFGATQIGASFTKADVTADDVAVAPSNGVYLAPVGKQATLYVDHHIADWEMTIGASAKWASSVAASSNSTHNYEKLEGYTFVNAYAEWEPAAYEGLNVRLGVDNLFDKKYSERSGFGTASRGTGPISLYPVYAPGRTVALNASIKF